RRRAASRERSACGSSTAPSARVRSRSAPGSPTTASPRFSAASTRATASSRRSSGRRRRRRTGRRRSRRARRDALAAAEAGTEVIEARALHKSYALGGQAAVEALRGVSLTVHDGELLAVMGASGSGKSTLLNLLGCLDRPTSGEYVLDGEN